MMYNMATLPRRRRRNPLAGIILLLIVLGGAGFFVYKAQTGNSISVDSGATLFIDECIGFVHIHAGTSNNQVVLQGLGSTFVPSSHAQDSDTIIISGCDLDITVPKSINININADAIEVFGVSGQMKLSTNGGSIILVQDTLQGKSELHNNGGPTVFQGSIASGASPTFDSNGGSLDISLPGDAAFHVKAEGNIDTFTTNFPDLATIDNHTLDASVGSSPQATLTLAVNGSSIILHKI
jgi:hypothetical protein